MLATMSRMWIVLGALAGLTGVALAAAGAHAFAPRVGPGGMEMLRSATQLQMIHALALILCGVWAERAADGRRRVIHLAALCFTLGLIAFSGTIHVLVLSGLRLPGVAPTGGTLLMIGWALLALAGLRRT